MKNTPIYQLIKEIDKIPFNSPECADYYNSLTKLFKRALEVEEYEFISTYSNGWHDGQEIIINRIEYINVGGEAAGNKFFNDTYSNK